MALTRKLAISMASICILALSAVANEKNDVMEITKQPTQVQATLTKVTARESKDGYFYRQYLVRLTAGESYIIEAFSNDFDVTLGLGGVFDDLFLRDDDSGGGTNAKIVFTPASTQTYRIAISAIDRKQGTFQLKIRKGIDWLATGWVEANKGNYKAAQKAFATAIDECSKENGPEHWKVTDIRMALQHAKLLEKMSMELRQQLVESDILMYKAGQCDSSGKHQESASYAQKALAIRMKILGEHHVGSAECLNWLGVSLDNAVRYTEAQPFLEKALAIREKLLGDNHPSTATSLNNLAYCIQSQGKWNDARPYYEKAVVAYERSSGKDHPDTAVALCNLGLLLVELADHEKALAIYERALAIREQSLGIKHAATATSFNNLGVLYKIKGDYSKAQGFFEKGLAVNEEVLGKDHPEVATTLNNLGLLCVEKGDYELAKTHFDRSIAICETRLGVSHPSTCTSVSNLGLLLLEQGRFELAQSLLRRALSGLQESLGEDHPDCAIALNNLGLAAASQGEFYQARTYYERSLKMTKKALGSQHPSVAVNLSNLAQIFHAIGDYPASRYHHEMALEIEAHCFGVDHIQTVRTQSNLACLLISIGDFPLAENHFAKLLALREKLFGGDHPDDSIALNNVGSLYLSQDKFAEAIPYFNRAIAVAVKAYGDNHPNTAMALSNLGVALGGQGEFARARPIHEKVLALRKAILGDHHPDVAVTWHNLGFCYLGQNDLGNAARCLSQAMAIERRSVEMAARAQSERQQLAMTLKLRSSLDAYLSVVLQDGQKASEAYSFVLAWKGLVSLEQRMLRYVRDRPECASLAQQLQDVCTQLANMTFVANPADPQKHRKQLNDLTLRREAIEVELSQKSSGFRLDRDSRSANPEALRAALPTDSVLVDYLDYEHSQPDSNHKGKWIKERRIAAFVIRKDRPICRVELGPATLIEEQITGWVQKAKDLHPLQGTHDEKARHPSMELRKLVWMPLEKHLDGVRNVLISPDGALTRLPFAALPGKDPAKFLLEERMVAIVPLPRLLPDPLEQASRNPEGSLLLVGDVDFGSSNPNAKEVDSSFHRAGVRGRGASWRSLSGSTQEMKAIRLMFDKHVVKGRIDELSQRDASEAAIRNRAGKYGCLHFATHGFFSPTDVVSASAPKSALAAFAASKDVFGLGGVVGFHPGLLSGIVLAGANQPISPTKDDGILTALEVAELNLKKTDLVVLSACETGLGKVAGGEGVLGLQRAFQLAGAKTVVSTLWRVHDDATRILMEKFYENLWRHRLPTGEALRQAQLWMMREGVGLQFESPLDAPRELAPPYFWAGFVLSGDWR